MYNCPAAHQCENSVDFEYFREQDPPNGTFPSIRAAPYADTSHTGRRTPSLPARIVLERVRSFRVLTFSQESPCSGRSPPAGCTPFSPSPRPDTASGGSVNAARRSFVPRRTQTARWLCPAARRRRSEAGRLRDHECHRSITKSPSRPGSPSAAFKNTIAGTPTSYTMRSARFVRSR